MHQGQTRNNCQPYQPDIGSFPHVTQSEKGKMNVQNKILCRRRKAKTLEQIMAPLPTPMLTKTLRAFTRTAFDFAVPFITVQGRVKRRERMYLFYTPSTTPAVDLEIVFGLDRTHYFTHSTEK